MKQIKKFLCFTNMYHFKGGLIPFKGYACDWCGKIIK